MAVDIFFGFDSGDPQDREWIERIQEYKKHRALGISHGLVRKVVKTKVGQIFVLPLARTMIPGQAYRASELATLLGPNWLVGNVVSKLNVLGKPESRYKARIFDRPRDGRYSISPAMKTALLAAVAAGPVGGQADGPGVVVASTNAII